MPASEHHPLPDRVDVPLDERELLLRLLRPPARQLVRFSKHDQPAPKQQAPKPQAWGKKNAGMRTLQPLNVNAEDHTCAMIPNQFP